jgi:hypothetical protein
MNRRPHSGQALVVMLAFMASLVGAFVLVFNVGQVVNDKIKLVNAADAAAYSAALWEARSLNYQAYLNRAIVANEVAIAQLVSLRSWSNYVRSVTGNVALVGQWIPPLAVPVRVLARGWQVVDRTVQATLPPFEGALSAWNVEVLSNTQAVAHQQAAIAAADLVTEVAHANEPRAQVTEATRMLQVRNAAEWQNRFTTRYRRGSGELRRFTDLLMASRDGFTGDRRGDLPVPLPLVSTPRRGGTDLVGEYSWRGVDSLSVHLNLLFKRAEIPVGWGAAEQQRLPVSRRGEHGGSLRTNPVASRLALRTLTPQRSYRGVPEIRDVIAPTRQDDRTLRYAVALSLPQRDVRTADRLIMPRGIALHDGGSAGVAPALAADAIHALGAAEIYFQRPGPRADGRREYPSLFSPYWQARLVAVTPAERTLTAPMRGLTVDPYAVLP